MILQIWLISKPLHMTILPYVIAIVPNKAKSYKNILSYDSMTTERLLLINLQRPLLFRPFLAQVFF